MILIPVLIVAYFFMGGVVGYVFYLWRRKVCGEHGPDFHPASQYSYDSCTLMHEPPAVIVGACWPAMVPMVAGMLIVHLLSDHEPRAQRKEQRRIADHERKMAEIEAQKEMTMDSIRFLVENGIKADVPGLYQEMEEEK